MSLRAYLVENRDQLPNPRGSLSSSLPSGAIAAANREVKNVRNKKMKKRGPYTK